MKLPHTWSGCHLSQECLQLGKALVGPTVTRPVKDPLAVLLLDNQLYDRYFGERMENNSAGERVKKRGKT